MNIRDFTQAIRAVFDKQHAIDATHHLMKKINFFFCELDKISSDTKIDAPLQMTRITILFEGFYRHLPESVLKIKLANVRSNRWNCHFGTPTLLFLLSYKDQIDKTKELFDIFYVNPPQNTPWIVDINSNAKSDELNNVITDFNHFLRVEAPAQREKTGFFTKTHNPFGGFTTTPCDPVSQAFIEHAALVAKDGGKVLEIGAAFGAATLDAIARGATVFCNDIDASNLAVVRQRFLETEDTQLDSITGDDRKLVFIPGALPHELRGLPEQFFDAILICRVLHFFTGSKIEESLSLLSRLLTPNGKIYIVCETPFLKNWQRFIPEFKNRMEQRVEWPGEITNPADYESSGRAESLPKFVHWITKDVLERSLSRAGLTIEHSAYIDRIGQFPEDLLLNGEESVGAIGVNEVYRR